MALAPVLLSVALIAAALLTIAVTIILSLIPVFIDNRSVASQTNTKSIRIAVVGGGISGLNAALTLVDSNLFSMKNIIIYEANTNTGGRIHTRRWSPDNQSTEWCAEFIDSNYNTLIPLTKRFDIGLIDTIAETNAVFRTTFYFLKRFYSQTQATIDYQAVASIIKEQVNQIGEINYQTSNSYGRFFDNMSLYDWIETYIPNGHRSDFGGYIDSAYQQEFGLDTEELNSLMFLKTLGPYEQPVNEPFSIYGSSDQRYRMRGGNAQLPTKIWQYLTSKGIRTELDHNLTKITRLANGKYRLKFANNRAFTFDHVILTLPTTTLKYVDYSQAQFDAQKRRVINELQYGTNTKLGLQFSKRFWYDAASDGVIYTDLPFLNSWETSLGQGGTTGLLAILTGGKEALAFSPQEAYEVSRNASGNTSANIYISNFLQNLNEVWPGASSYYTGESTIGAPWFDKYSLGSYPAYKRNQYSTLSGSEGLRQGNVHFSGDYTSTDYLGLMEGATSEGERAAKEIISDYTT